MADGVADGVVDAEDLAVGKYVLVQRGIQSEAGIMFQHLTVFHSEPIHFCLLLGLTCPHTNQLDPA